MDRFPLVAIRAFIEATRDSGYKSTSSALAELIDNAFEADARSVDVTLFEDAEDGKRIPCRLLGRGGRIVDE